MAGTTGTAGIDRRVSFRTVSWAVLIVSAVVLGPRAHADTVVTSIRVIRLDVFDPETLGALAPIGRIGNTIHVTTRDHVVRDLLLFEPGDRVTPDLLRESARVLRDSGLFRTATVAFAPDTSGVVVVRTRDLWSTQLTARFSSTAGNDELVLGGFETNFLGHGDLVSALYRWSDEANRARFGFTKRRFFGSHSFAGIAYGDGDEGVSRDAFVSQPYYSTTASWSGALDGSSFDGKVWLYDAGDETGRYALHRDRAYAHGSAYWGHGARWQLGGSVHIEDRITRALSGDARTLGSLRNDHRRQVSIGLGHSSRRFVRLSELDLAGDIEDHAVGHVWGIVTGLELESLGSTDTRPYASVSGEASVRLARFTFASTGVRVFGYWRDGRPEERAIVGNVRLFNQRWRGRTQAFRAVVRWGDRTSPEDLLYVGANTGMRGFPFRNERGNRLLVANLEERWFPGITPLGVDVGIALFADAGGAWADPKPARFRDLEADVGVGLRVRKPGLLPYVLRIDVGRGLGPGGDWQLTLSTGEAFGLRRRLDFDAPLPERFAGSFE